MNGTNGIIDLKELGMLAIVSFDSKGRIQIPHKIRNDMKGKFGLYRTGDTIILKEIR